MTPEIMAPAGSYESLQAAIQAGADSVYFGIGKLNMRARAADNFTLSDLKKIAKICQKHRLRSYLTLNTIIYDEDLALMRKICSAAKKAGVTAVICCDLAVMSYVQSIGLSVHLSTQANVSNIEAVKFYSQFADVIVLARELTLEQIRKIVKEVRRQNIIGPGGKQVKLEIFVHGALCVSISGKCYLSLAQYNHSANRGDCLQACRRAYRVIDEETGDELKVENKYVMSPKDLCTIGCIDQILSSGVDVLKIEGRGRSPEYVYTVVKAYKEAVQSCLDRTYSQDKVKGWLKELEKVFNRGFWQGGYYLGRDSGEWSGAYGSKSTTRKEYLGTIRNYYHRAKTAEAKLDSGKLQVGDEIIIIGPTTVLIEEKIKNLLVEDRKSNQAKKGDTLTFPLEEKVRKNDKLFLVVKNE